MSVTVLSQGLPLSVPEIERLWSATRDIVRLPDEDIALRVVSTAEITELNKKYRKKDAPTNVLTFSYETEHDVALCLEIAEEEAREHGVDLREYVAWLIAHAFIHAGGIDHEASPEEEARMREAEEAVLAKSGFSRPAIY